MLLLGLIGGVVTHFYHSHGIDINYRCAPYVYVSSLLLGYLYIHIP